MFKFVMLLLLLAFEILNPCFSAHRKIFGRNQTKFFGYGIVTIELFEKKMFQIICHMMGCNDSSGKHRQRGGTASAWPLPTPLPVLA